MATASADEQLHRPTPEPEQPRPISLAMRVANVVTIIVPFVGLIVAAIWMWGGGFNLLLLGLLLVMYTLTGLGITIGYHRLFTHRSFETNRLMEFILAVLGSMAIQGPLLRWVAQHRLHHQRSDMRGDPHSPHLHGGGFWGLVRGLWHAHLGWICGGDMPHLNRYIPDLMRSRLLRTVSSLFPLWVLLSMLVPTLIGGLWAGTWTGALLGFIWGGLVRVFCVHHVTWSVNSICHVWGTRPFQCDDQSRNNFVIGVLAFGEGWHNNHHAFPTSARHGLRWWQVDVSYLIIRAMALLGLAWNVKVASPRAMAASSRR